MMSPRLKPSFPPSLELQALPTSNPHPPHSTSDSDSLIDFSFWHPDPALNHGEKAFVPPKSDRDSDKLPLLTKSRSGSKEHKVHKEIIPVGASMGSAVFNLATTIIGAGIMALPATMKVLGLPLGLFLIVGMGFLSEASIEMLIFFSTKMKAWSYGETVQGACGSVGRAFAEISIIVNNSGILIVYLIIMGDVMSGSSDHMGLFDQWAGRAGWWSDRRVVVFLTLVFVLAPLVSLKKIDSLSFSSALSVALAMVFVLLLTAIAVVKLTKRGLEKPRVFPATGSKKAILDLLVVIPIMTNAYICHFNVQPIYCELKERTPATMNKVGRISTTLCVTVYAMTAVSGYLLFGEATASDVLSNFDTDLGIGYSTILSNVIRVGYVIHLMLVFPVIHFSLRQAVDSFFFPRAKPLGESKIRFVCTTLLLLCCTYSGFALIPNIWIAFEFTGATTGLSLGFIFPSLVALRWRGEGSKSRKALRFLSWMMLAMAVVASIVGVVGNAVNLEA